MDLPRFSGHASLTEIEVNDACLHHRETDSKVHY